MTAEEDIGKVVARAVNDPRTANKRLVVKGSDFTQNQVIAAWEKVSGKMVARQAVSAEDLNQIINGAPTQVPDKRVRRTSCSQQNAAAFAHQRYQSVMKCAEGRSHGPYHPHRTHFWPLVNVSEASRAQWQ